MNASPSQTSASSGHGTKPADAMASAHPFTVTAADGYPIHGHAWRHGSGGHGSECATGSGNTNGRAATRPVVIINPATSVRARYYARFAAFLFGHGFDVITYDYRGIGDSRRGSLRGFQGSWLDWGHLDFDAALRHAEHGFPGQPIQVVAHSIGGFVIGLAPNNHKIQRIFTMGAQFAHWRDYASGHRLRMLAKWHVAMPALTALLGYFPGKRLGWLEDTPAGVVRDWGWSWSRLEDTCRRGTLAIRDVDREALVRQFAAVTAPTLAVGMADDEFGTIPAIERLLSYYRRSPSVHLRITPAAVGEREIGHFAFFHSRFESTLWPIPLEWLKSGTLPADVPGVVLDRGAAGRATPAFDGALAVQEH